MNDSENSTNKNADKTESNQSNNEKTMNNNSSNQNSNNQAGGMNVPDWVMHLLTGAGSMGGSYLLFIKPLQEKFDDMQKQITDQNETIEVLQAQINQLIRKQNNKALSGGRKEYSRTSFKEQSSDESEHEEDEDDNDDKKQSEKSQKNYGLFSLKKKTPFHNQSNNKGNVRF